MAKKKPCGACGGNGGTWIIGDGQKPSKKRWVVCRQCNGTGEA